MPKTISLYNGDVTLEFDAVKHAYRWGEKLIPGVTRIIGILDKPALVQWAANMASEYFRDQLNMPGARDIEIICKEAKTAHRRLSKSATDTGKEVHAFAERALVDHRIKMPEEAQARKGAEAFLGWLHATEIRPISVERMVFSKKHYYAGTCDYYGHIYGKLAVMDLKTSSGLYAEMLLQLAAYSIAISEETGEPINDGWVVRLDKKSGKCEPYHIPITNGLRDAFLRVREAHSALQHVETTLKEIKDAPRTDKAIAA